MKITNEYGLPEPFWRATQKEEYDRGEADYTASELISPPRQYQLRKRHDSELTEDCSERLWVLGGTVAHEILARAGREEKELFEKRLYADVSGKRVGGKLDTLALADGLLSDYKWTTVWSYIKGREEWVWQTNIYGFLARENGFKVNALEIFGMFRDWADGRAKGSNDYPPRNCMRIPVEMWPHEKTRDFIKARIALHERAKLSSDDFLSPCTKEERWEEDDVFALMKPGRKSAVKLYDTQAEAEAAKTGAMYVAKRPGLSKRCARYCPVGKATGICKQWMVDKTNPINSPKEEGAVCV